MRAYAYDPYGAQIVTTSNSANALAENPYTFGGNGVRDRTTNWVHYGARYYSTVTGAFTQQDSLDAPLDAGNANRYAYAGGDLINNVDPTGRDISVPTGAAYGGAWGGLAGCAVGAAIGGTVGSAGGPVGAGGDWRPSR